MVNSDRGIRYAAALAILSLSALLLTPFLFARHIDGLRERITTSLEPAREASGDIRLALAREVGAIRGFLLTSQRGLLSDYQAARASQTEAVSRLAAVKGLDTETLGAFRRLEAAIGEWNSRNDRLVGAPATTALAPFIDSLPSQHQRYQAALDESEALDKAVVGGLTTVRGRIARAERFWAAATVALGLVAAAAAALVILMLRAALRETTLARTDSLTGLHNRRGFTELAQRELNRVRRHPTPTTILAFDLDGFKQVNDQRGHAVGDRLLQTVGRALQDAVREVDLAARLGGDEFAVLLSENTAHPPEFAVNRVRTAVADRLRKDWGTVTLSVGAVTVRDATRNVDELIRAADTLMYEAKNAGKNTMRHAVLLPVAELAR